MKKYSSILQEIKKKSEQMRKAEQDAKILGNELKEIFPDWMSRKNATEEQKAHYEKVSSEQDKLFILESDLKMEIAFLRNNLKLALFAESLPALCSLLEKYNGKQFGTVTEKKFREEFKSLTGFNCYISSNNEEICVYDGMNCEVKFGAGYDKKVLIGNTVTARAQDVFHPYYIKRTYIESPKKQVALVKKEFSKLKKLNEQYRESVKAYNDLTVDGFLEFSTCVYVDYMM